MMREESDIQDFWSAVRLLFRNHMRALASIGFMLVAVGAIHYEEHLSPTLGRFVDACTTQATKTARVAQLAWMSAALPFLIRG